MGSGSGHMMGREGGREGEYQKYYKSGAAS